MSTRDQIIDAMDGKGDDCPPAAVFTQTGTVSQMDACGSCWPEANFDASKMVELALQAHKRFGFGTIRIPFDITVQAEAFGCSVDKGRKNSQPAVMSSPFNDGSMEIPPVPEDFIPVEEFMKNPRIRTMLEATELASGHGLFSTAAMTGPLGSANDILGMENVMMALMMGESVVKSWVAALKPHAMAYAEALSSRCDNVLIIEEITTDLIPAEYFESVTAGPLKDVIKSARSDSYCSIHCCGSTIEVADKVSALGEDALSPQASDCMEEYVGLVNGRTRLLGSVNPVDTLLMGTPADVVAQAKKSAEAGFDLITPECGIPPETPDENMLALSEYASR